MNLANAEYQGRGIMLEFNDVTEDMIYNALTELLENPKYKENAELIANRFKDRPMTPEQTVVYWTEYVARHKGAKFLRAAGADLNFIEFYNLDVYATFLIEVLIVLFINFWILRMIFRKLFKKKTEKKKKN